MNVAIIERGYCDRTRTQWTTEVVNYTDDAANEMELITLESVNEFFEVD